MSKTCSSCDNFNPHEKKPDGPGFCDVHKDFFLPSGSCRRYRRVDSETAQEYLGPDFMPVDPDADPDEEDEDEEEDDDE